VYALLGLLISYAVGSIPAAYLAGRAAGVDLRAQGSGNLGATNVVRVLGLRMGLLVFAVDLAKGAAPVALLPRLLPAGTASPWLPIAYGAAAIIGHTRPLWLGFRKGGKGVATACGVFLALAPVPTLLAVAVFAAAFGTTGYVSLGSLTAALALPALVAAGAGARGPVFVVSVLVALFVFLTHRPNMGRLVRGEEHRFSRMGNLGAPVGLATGLAVAAGAVVWLVVRGGGR
jgi:acyl phosphate:glycerol-3-phosphate acyltransferase